MAYIYDLTDTWNAGGTTFYGIKMNVTNTASASGSKLLSLQVGGSELFGVGKNGDVGIGTASPSAPLHVKLATDRNARFLNAYTGVALGATTDGGSETKLTFFGNPLAFVTNDAERMRVDASGNVGIGTSAPGSKLEVSSGYITAGTTSSATGSKIAAGYWSGTEHLTTLGSSYSSGGPVLGYAVWPSNTAEDVFVSSAASGLQRGAYRISGGAHIWHGGAAQPVAVGSQVSMSEWMRITDTGSLGIGLLNHAARGDLDVSSGGTATAITKSIHLGFSQANFYGFRIANTNTAASTYAGTFSIQRGNGAAWVDDLTISDAGNVGIGTTTPTAYSGYTSLEIDNAGNGGILSIKKAGSVVGYLNGVSGMLLLAQSHDLKLTTTGSTSMQFSTNGTERMRIDSSGNLLVGTTTILNGSKVTIDSGTTWGLGLKAADNGGTYYFAQFYAGASGVGSINSNGTGTSYNTSSDARLKENIAPADDAAALIDAIQVRKFDWKADGSHQRYGFVAQELIEVAPEAVNVPADEDAMMGVDYSKLVPMLVKEIQSLRARVAQLEGN